MEHKQYYHFKKSTSEPNVTTSSEHFYVCGEDAVWDDVMRQFAAFLDSCGYVGVYEKVDKMLDEEGR
tara:strand:- start:8349 stop:8549 length:201 start_codon:yes stop_codon:yes gene_type:complete